MYLKFDYDDRKNVGMVTGDYFDQIRQTFSVHNEAHRFAKYRGGFAPRRKYVITPTGRFDPCLYYEIRKYLTSNHHQVKLHKTDKFRNNVHPAYNITDIPQLSLKLRDYQRDIVNVCLRIGRGVTVLATAGGKTLTIAALIEAIYRHNKDLKALVLVPDIGLVTQTSNDFKEYGTSFFYSKWTGSNDLNLGSNVIISNLGIMQSSKSDLSWLPHIDLLIVDEVHKLRRDNKINKILKTIQTPNKFGFTGTMPENQIDQWNIIGKIGPILFERNSFQLRQEKYVANVKVQILKLEYNKKPKAISNTLADPGKKYRSELEFITNNKFRNNVLIKLSNKFDNNALILVDHIKHGEILHQTLTDNCSGKQVFFIRGSVPVEERDEVKQLMEQKKDIICIAISKIFSTGINIKNLHYIVFCSGGKAKIKTIQSIGRGLRLHKDKQNVIIVDIADQLCYGYKHMTKRIKHYKSEKIDYGIQKIRETEKRKKAKTKKKTK